MGSVVCITSATRSTLLALQFQGSFQWVSLLKLPRLARMGVQSGRPIFDDFFQHLWPYISNNTANVVFQMVKRLWLIRIDQ
ncbi:hypothetical protein TNCV_4181581 [Trichonephila clavipes]|nr:hypothetical protein TNCV_4181581 [Trichonephila clavipes]